MNGGSPIREWRAEPDAAAHPVATSECGGYDAPEIDGANPMRWLLPSLAALLVVLWVAGAGWLALGSVAVMTWPAVIEFAAAVAIIPILIGVLWLLTQRTSRAEARRFGRTAAAMRAEAAALEGMVARLTTAIDTQRSALADQARAMASLGEHTSERMARVGASLSADIDHANRHAAALASATSDAASSLDALLTALPRAQAQTRAAAAQLDDVAEAASEQAVALDAQLAALALRGREAEAAAGSAAERLVTHIATMAATSDAAGARLDASTNSMATAVDALFDRTAQAVDDSRQGIAAQGDAMLAMVGAHQARLDHAARESVEALASRIEVVELIVDRVAQRLGAQRVAGDAIVGELESGIARVQARLDTLHTQGVERSQHLAANISALGGSADAMTEALRTGDAMATHAIGTAETLLIALDAAAREIDETLPDALGRLDARIAQSRQVVVQAKPELLALVTAAESTHDAIEAIAQVIAGQRTALDRLSGSLIETLSTGRAKADALGATVDESITRANRFAQEAAPRLLEALLRVRDTANAAADRAREALAAVVPDAAGQFEAASAAAFARAAGASVDRQVAAITGAADAAVAAATQASERLAERLREIAEQTALVETRLEDGRTEREVADRDSFARRVSLLIERLNSASIDLAKSFSPEVSDSAWAAYLKGDRGVFTRRAVRLLDVGEAREVGRLYDEDADFREQVNRYIHDFEAMLRTILTQRDGSPLGVTLLSSDMGKLYVALAQAIERLR